jgi:hypothetical protein
VKRARLVFQLHGWWRAGTSRGVASTLDALIARDADDLPYLPGRSIKGVLRDSLAQWEYWQTVRIDSEGERSGAADEITTALFGSRWDGAPEQTRYNTRPGALTVSSARMAPELRAALRQRKDRDRLMTGLSSALRSTAVDHSRGAALQHSLRAVEVAVPLDLYCEVEGPDQMQCAGHPQDLDWRAPLKESLGFLRAVGSGRHRGLGRVEVTLEHTDG